MRHESKVSLGRTEVECCRTESCGTEGIEIEWTTELREGRSLRGRSVTNDSALRSFIFAISRLTRIETRVLWNSTFSVFQGTFKARQLFGDCDYNVTKLFTKCIKYLYYSTENTVVDAILRKWCYNTAFIVTKRALVSVSCSPAQLLWGQNYHFADTNAPMETSREAFRYIYFPSERSRTHVRLNCT